MLPGVRNCPGNAVVEVLQQDLPGMLGRRPPAEAEAGYWARQEHVA
jgi:hypothetical protein